MHNITQTYIHIWIQAEKEINTVKHLNITEYSLPYKLRLHCIKFKKKLINSQFVLRWRDFCNHRGEFMPVFSESLRTCSKNRFSYDSASEPLLLWEARPVFCSMECDGVPSKAPNTAPVYSVLVQRALHANMSGHDLKAPSPLRPRTDPPSILLELSWCWSSTPHNM